VPAHPHSPPLHVQLLFLTELSWLSGGVPCEQVCRGHHFPQTSPRKAHVVPLWQPDVIATDCLMVTPPQDGWMTPPDGSPLHLITSAPP
jgi:hypothetical protein